MEREGKRCVDNGELKRALYFFEKALKWAQENASQELIDRAYCNWAAVAISIGEGREVAAKLRKILFRYSDTTNRFLASYNLARLNELEKNFRKSIFYAKIALQEAQKLNNLEWIASSYNQIANAQLALGKTKEAIITYQKAEKHTKDCHRLTAIEINLGYSFYISGEKKKGKELLKKAYLKSLSIGDKRLQALAICDLAYIALEESDTFLMKKSQSDLERLFNLAEEKQTRMKVAYLLLDIYRKTARLDKYRILISKLACEAKVSCSVIEHAIELNCYRVINLHS